MHIAKAVGVVALVCLPGVHCRAQTPAPGAQTPAASTTPVASGPASPSPAAPAPAAAGSATQPLLGGILQPALSSVEQTVGGLKTEKWKRGTVRDEASSDIGKIVQDIHVTLPGLISAADAEPDAVSKSLPVVRNVDALYDVLLRVFEASRVAAPGDQAGQIEQALDGLQKARLALDDRLQDSSTMMEKQVVDLRANLKEEHAARMAIKPPPAPVCPAPPPVHRVKRKPVAKPAAPGTPVAKPGATGTPTTTPAKPSN